MNLSPAQVIEKVKNAGIVGAGGAGFPTHVKLNSRVKVLIANAASCEPLVNSDFSLMLDKPEALLKSMSIVMDITGAKEGYIAIKKKHKSIINSLEKHLKNYPDKRLNIYQLDDFYPAGDEFILVYEIIKKVIPERALPLEVGCLVQNVTTLIQIAEALEDKPLTSRIVTVTGQVNNPQDLLLPLGTSFAEAINLVGGVNLESYKIIHGGPMMGKLVTDPENEFVQKTTSMILVLPSEHLLILKRMQTLNTTLKLAKSVCCQCTKCTDLCPRGLIGHPIETHKIMRTVAFNLDEPSESVISSYLCSECGLCSMYSCTMGLIPHMVNSEIKGALARNSYKFKRLYDDYEVEKEIRESRKVPTKRLMARLDVLKYYDLDIKFNKTEYKPQMVKISLSQHIGAKAVPVVKKGDTVKTGDLIADIDSNKLGAKIHASISGKILSVNENDIVIKG